MSELTEDTNQPGTAADGLDLLQERIRNGPPVPIGEVLDMRCISAERGRVVFAAAAEPRFANPMGGLHGGVAATLLDSAAGCAVMTALPPGKLYTTLTLELKYLKAVPLDGRQLIAEGTVIHTGRRQMTAEARLTDDQDRLIATATSTCMVID